MGTVLYSFRNRGFFIAGGEHLKLKVNGEEYATQRTTLLQLLDEMGIVPGGVAVEVNLRVIKGAEYDYVSLNEGDMIEIVKFVGGG
jgi:sulfur carrier protein